MPQFKRFDEVPEKRQRWRQANCSSRAAGGLSATTARD